jgi:hypothetical protein
MAKPYRILFTKAEASPEKTLLFRIFIVLALIFLVMGILWLDRDGLKDQKDNHISFPDVIYFAMVTITTVGYGDIVPVTERARLIDALLIPQSVFLSFLSFWEQPISLFSKNLWRISAWLNFNEHYPITLSFVVSAIPGGSQPRK